MKYRLGKIVVGVCIAIIIIYVIHFKKAFAESTTVMDKTSLLELTLEFTEPLNLSATIENRSDKAQSFLSRCLYAPCRIRLESVTTGDTITYKDMRARMRYSIKDLDSWSYYKLQPGKAKKYHSAPFKLQPDNTYTLRWCDFIFNSIPPGMYRIVAQWESKLDIYYDIQIKKSLDVWKGKLVSKEITITLP